MTPTQPQLNLELGELVTDGVITGKLVVDIDAGTALPPYIASDWTHYKQGVMIKTRRYGLVHCGDRARLDFGSYDDGARTLKIVLILAVSGGLTFLLAYCDPWNGRMMGKGWSCNGAPASGQVCVKNVPTPAAPTPAPG